MMVACFLIAQRFDHARPAPWAGVIRPPRFVRDLDPAPRRFEGDFNA